MYGDYCSDFEPEEPECEETCFTIGLSCEDSDSCDDSVDYSDIRVIFFFEEELEEELEEETIATCQPVIEGDCSDPCCLPSLQLNDLDIFFGANWYILQD